MKTTLLYILCFVLTIKINAQIGFQKHLLSSNFESVIMTKVADIDGDGDLDVVAGNLDKLVWFENIDGIGTFGTEHSIDAGHEFSIIEVTDIDNDGDLDVLSSSNNDAIISLSYYKNTNGTGSFSNSIPIPTEYNIRASFSTADLDLDGLPDIVMASIRSSGAGDYNDVLAWHKNMGIDASGDLQWSSEHEIMPFNDLIREVSIADIDGDHDLDIVTSLHHEICLLKNSNASESFIYSNIATKEASSFTLKMPSNMYLSDMDNDGDSDLVTNLTSINKTHKLVWYKNEDGLGTFGNEIIIDEKNSVFHMPTAIDIDSDNDNDILYLSYSEDKIFWFENTNALGSFGPCLEVATTPLRFPKSIGTGDIDFDGDIDLIVPIESEDEIAYYENLGLLGNTISGTIRSDSELNGCDGSDLPTPSVKVTSTNGVHSFSTFTQSDGSYILYTNAGDFTTSVSSEIPNFYTLNPNAHNSNFVGLNNTDTADFCLQTSQTIRLVSTSMFPITQARPGFEAGYQLVFQNVGSTQLNGTIVLDYNNAKLNFLDSSPTISSQTSNTLTFNYSDLNPFETRTIDLTFLVFPPPTTNIDDILEFTITVDAVGGYSAPCENVYAFQQTVIGSYDPNDILVLEGNQILLDDVDSYLHYIIRFQNTGTADAINVRVDNVLDSNLDWNSFHLESTSHSGRVEIKNGNDVAFIFNGIHLPDSTTNERDSHGFITYKIKPKPGIHVGDIMQNKADIFFDFNPAIVTNTVHTQVTNTLKIDKNESSNFQVFSDSSRDILNIRSRSQIGLVKIYNNLAQKILSQFNKTLIDISLLNTGLYFIMIEDLNGYTETKKFVRE